MELYQLSCKQGFWSGSTMFAKVYILVCKDEKLTHVFQISENKYLLLQITDNFEYPVGFFGMVSKPLLTEFKYQQITFQNIFFVYIFFVSPVKHAWHCILR